MLFWAEIYYQARSLPTGSLRPLFVLLNAAVYAIQVRLGQGGRGFSGAHRGGQAGRCAEGLEIGLWGLPNESRELCCV